MDSLYRSPSLNLLVNIEHQSQISNPIMFRNLKYFVTTKDKHKMKVHQYIFYTGKKKVPSWYAYDNQVYHHPYLMQTCLNNGLETFNTIKNKLKNNQYLPSSDIFELVWLPCFGKIETDDEFLKEYIDVVSKLKTHEYFSLLEIAIFGWVGYLNTNNEMIEHLKENFNMIPLDSPEFEEFLATAINERELEKKDRIIEEKDRIIEKLQKELDCIKETGK